MTKVPTNLIPTRTMQLPQDPAPSVYGYFGYVRDGVNYRVQVNDVLTLNGVPVTRQVIAGTGLYGGGQLSSDVTLNVAPGGIGPSELAATGVTAGTYGSGSSIPQLTVDAQGRITAASALPFSVSGYVPDSRQIIAGAGLLGGGTLSSNVTLAANLSNSTPLSGYSVGGAGVSTEMARYDHQHPAVNLGVDMEVDGILGLSNGGTGNSLVPNNGALAYSGADRLYLTSAPTTGQIPQWDGSGFSWTTTATLAPQSANTFYAGPVSGAPVTPFFRAISSVDLPVIDHLDFNTGATVTPAVGRVWWNGGTTLNVGMTANVTAPVNESSFYYIKADAPITKGQVVMFAGAVGASSVLKGAPATGVTDGTYIMGVAAENIAHNGFGMVQNFGTLHGIDASAFLDGDILYYNPAVVGGLTATMPSAPNVKVQIAAVTHNGSGGSGSIFIRVSPGSKLGETDSNAQITSPTDAQLLQYYGAGQYWRNVSAGSITGIGSVANAVTFNSSGGAAPGSTFNGSVARTVDYSTIGAPKADGTGAIGTWGIGISGNAATATSATTATNLAGGAANRISYQSGAGATTFVVAPSVSNTYLRWDGTAFAWGTVTTGTVTSVGLSAPVGFSVSGSPVTSSGTLALSFSAGYSLPTTASQTNWDTAYTDRLKWDGGATGLVAATGRTSLGLGTSAVLNAGVAGGVATLDGGGTVPTSQLPAAVLGAVKYQGTWNASTNTPTLTSSVGTQGYYYVVSVAGSTNLNGITDWKIGDWAIYNGSAWQKVDNTDAVSSVNGFTGTVVLGYADVGAPSTSGTGATGTWGISISGNAATATSATTATNLAGGSAGTIPYQSAVGVTDQLAAGTANYVLKSNGTAAPSWTPGTISGIQLGSNLATLTLNTSGTGLSGSTTYNGSGASTFTVTSNATSANTASTIVARDASGNFTAGTITAALTGNASTATTATNQSGGTVSATTGSFSGITQITNATASTTSANGALVVTGGVGIGGRVNVNEIVNRITGNGNSAWLQQDGTGRVHWYWNTYGGTSPVFTNAGEDAGDIMMTVNNAGAGANFQFRSASGVGKIAGDPITWTVVLYADLNSFTYKGNSVGVLAGVTQTWTASNTFSSTFALSGTTTNVDLGSPLTTGTIQLGGTAQTGTQTVGQSTKTHTLNIGSGATENTLAKTINIGANGVSGSSTTISVGSAVAGATTTGTLYGSWNLPSGLSGGTF